MEIAPELVGRLSLCCFSSTAAASFFLLIPWNMENSLHSAFIIFTSFGLTNILMRILLRNWIYAVAVRASFLGSIFALGIFVATTLDSSWNPFGIYICLLAFFHYSEFYTTALINPKSLSLNSFLLSHSKEYAIAALASWVEFLVERYFFPNLKTVRVVSMNGAILCICGEILRKAAMLTAKSNFNHVVQSVHEDGHVLVTHGVYSLFRHPSYVGWFYWSIGTQILLMNPICMIAYTLASWRFFRDRIFMEEVTLVHFFGYKYREYQMKVGTGLPFINGYRHVASGQ